MGPEGPAASRDRLHAGARDHAGFHRRPVHRGPGGDARGHRAARRRPAACQPARARGAGHRSFGAGRRVWGRRFAQAQQRDRIRPQRRALHVSALGPDRFQQLQGGSPEHRHRASGEHRAAGAGGVLGRRERQADRLSRYAGGNRLPHHHGQRARRAGLGRGRHRGRGGDARSAGHHAHSPGHRLQAHGGIAGRHHRDRPGADGDGDPAQERRGRQIRRVLRRRPEGSAARRPCDHRQHVARVRVHLRDLPDR